MKKQKQSAVHKTPLDKGQTKSKPFFLPEKLFRFPAFHLILLGIVALIYAWSISFGYTYFDDDAIIIKNKSVIEKANIHSAFTTDAEFHQKGIELYRPLQSITYIADANIGGVNPWIFHLTNILLHFLTSCAVFWLFRALKYNEKISTVVVLLFATHPLFTHAIAWIPSRGDLLLALFSVLSIAFFITHINNKKPIFLLLHFITFFLACLSKESAVLIIFIDLFYYFIISKRKVPIAKIVIYFTVYTGLTLGFLSLRSHAVLSTTGGNFGLSSFFHNLPVIPEIIAKFILPVQIPVMPSYNIIQTITGIVFMIAICILIFKFIKGRRNILLFGLLWFFLFTIPAMMYNPSWSGYAYDYCVHRSYLPMIGLSILFAEFFQTDKFVLSKTFWTMILITVVGYGSLSFIHLQHFSDAKSFYSFAVKTNSGSALAWENLGNADFMNKSYPDAFESYSKAITLKPDFADAYYNRGITNTELKNYQEAITDFNQVIALNPPKDDVYKYRGYAYTEIKDFNKAVKDFSEYLKKHSKDIDALYKRGNALFFLNDFKAAIADYSAIIKIDSTVRDAYFARGNAWLQLSKTNEAVKDYLQVFHLDSTDVNICNNLAFAYIENENYSESQIYFKKALRLDPKYFDAVFGMMLASYQLKDIAGTKIYFTRAAGLEPLLKEGVKGITKLESQGYFYTPKQKAILKNIFETLKL
jgi:tetratricopeptide (TPR) repeat protein